MSLVQSAKLNGNDPHAYLNDVLTRLPTHLNSLNDELLPHNWKPSRWPTRPLTACTPSRWDGQSLTKPQPESRLPTRKSSFHTIHSTQRSTDCSNRSRSRKRWSRSPKYASAQQVRSLYLLQECVETPANTAGFGNDEPAGLPLFACCLKSML